MWDLHMWGPSYVATYICAAAHIVRGTYVQLTYVEWHI
jgi:hypothetical protein